MRILMPFLGSRGDVQPGVALALELRRRGHEVTLGVPPNLVQLARDAGCEPVAMGPDSAQLLASDLVQHEIKSSNPIERWRALSELGSYGWDELATDLASRASEADVIVSCLLGQEVARAIAERFGLAQVAVHYYPVRRSQTVSMIPPPPVGAKLTHAASWAALERSWRLMTRRGEDRMRAGLGLPASMVPLAQRMASSGSVEVQAIDPELFPGLSAEWGTRRPLVGFLDLPREVHRRLSGGFDETWVSERPCIYWGFGSMPMTNSGLMLELVHEVSQRLGTRAFFATGWSELAATSDDTVRVVNAVDHGAVLPHCVAAVHHGGAGTTAAALRAGTPSLVAWINADQPLWGRRLRELGVGAVVRQRALTIETAVAELSPLLDGPTQERAQAVADRLVPAYEAVAQTADLIELAAARREHRLTKA